MENFFRKLISDPRDLCVKAKAWCWYCLPSPILLFCSFQKLLCMLSNMYCWIINNWLKDGFSFSLWGHFWRTLEHQRGDLMLSLVLKYTLQNSLSVIALDKICICHGYMSAHRPQLPSSKWKKHIFQKKSSCHDGHVKNRSDESRSPDA